jgi:hypothetical protein
VKYSTARGMRGSKGWQQRKPVSGGRSGERDANVELGSFRSGVKAQATNVDGDSLKNHGGGECVDGRGNGVRKLTYVPAVAQLSSLASKPGGSSFESLHCDSTDSKLNGSRAHDSHVWEQLWVLEASPDGSEIP